MRVDTSRNKAQKAGKREELNAAKARCKRYQGVGRGLHGWVLRMRAANPRTLGSQIEERPSDARSGIRAARSDSRAR
ncbi:protein of unknown function [Pararobbsia alpina]